MKICFDKLDYETFDKINRYYLTHEGISLRRGRVDICRDDLTYSDVEVTLNSDKLFLELARAISTTKKILTNY